MEVFGRIYKKFLLNTIANSLNDTFFKLDGHNEENIENSYYLQIHFHVSFSRTIFTRFIFTYYRILIKQNKRNGIVSVFP